MAWRTVSKSSLETMQMGESDQIGRGFCTLVPRTGQGSRTMIETHEPFLPIFLLVPLHWRSLLQHKYSHRPLIIELEHNTYSAMLNC